MPKFFLVGDIEESVISIAQAVKTQYGLPEHIDSSISSVSKIKQLDDQIPSIFLGHASPDDFGGKSPKEFADLLITKGLPKTKKIIHVYLLGCQFDQNVGGYGEKLARYLQEKGYINIVLHLFDPSRFEYTTQEGSESNWYKTFLHTTLDDKKNITWTYYGVAHSDKEALNEIIGKIDNLLRKQNALNSEEQTEDKLNEFEKTLSSLEAEYMALLKKHTLASHQDPIKLVNQFGKKITILPPKKASSTTSMTSLLFKDEEKKSSSEIAKNILVSYEKEKIIIPSSPPNPKNSSLK